MKTIKTKGKVLRVIDGDTVQVALTIRLAEVDAPETKGIEREMGLKTKEWLEDRLLGKNVELEITASDVYRRLLAYVIEGEENINDELLEERLAEVYSPSKHNDGKLDI